MSLLAVRDVVVDVVARHPGWVLLTSNAATGLLVLLAVRGTAGIKDALRETVMSALKAVPGVQGAIEKEQAKIVEKMKHKVIVKVGGPAFRRLPENGLSQEAIIAAMQEWVAKETTWGTGRVSGTVYHGGKDLTKLIVQAFEAYALSNPLHVDVFPSIRKMESEVISMTAALFGGGPEIVGSLTSGGTESIAMAVKTYKEVGKARGVRRPNMVVPVSAHAAFDKAADYMEIELRHYPVDPVTFRAIPSAAAKLVDKNTIMLVASAPSFPQGVIDPVSELAAIARKWKIGLHVDCCLGSFLIPFAKQCGRKVPAGVPHAWLTLQIPEFDFDVDGVTSISVDTHKFGFAPKGSSVVLYRNADLRRHQFFVQPTWPGGIYATPTYAGSRPGALIAGAWATLVHLGRKGYETAAQQIFATADEIVAGIRQIPELKWGKANAGDADVPQDPR